MTLREIMAGAVRWWLKGCFIDVETDVGHAETNKNINDGRNG